MALTFDLSPAEGGIVISGSAEELADLSQCIDEAVDGLGEVIGSLLTDEGVEELRVRVVEP